MSEFFDRKKFNPAENWHDSQRLRSLRAYGAARRSPSSALKSLRLPDAQAAGLRFIDIGCGDSRDASLASKRGYESVGLDLFPPSQELAPFVQADAVEQWPFQNESVYAITCQAMIDLVIPAERALLYREAFRVLSKAGAFSLYGQSLSGGYGFDQSTEIERVRSVGFRAVESTIAGFVAVK